MKSPSAIPALPALEQSSWASGTGFCFPPRVLPLPLWSFTLEMELLGSPVSSVTLEKCAPSRGERVCVCARACAGRRVWEIVLNKIGSTEWAKGWRESSPKVSTLKFSLLRSGRVQAGAKLMLLHLTPSVICHCLQIDTYVSRGASPRVCSISFPVWLTNTWWVLLGCSCKNQDTNQAEDKNPLGRIVLAIPSIYTGLLLFKAFSIYCCTLSSPYSCEEEPAGWWQRHLSSVDLVSFSSSPFLDLGSPGTHCFASSVQLSETT